MKKIPFLLIYSRIVIALVIIFLAWLKVDNYSFIITILILVGLLTDIFDGIIARKLNVSTEKLRIWDSNVDMFFWLSVIASIFYLRFELVKPHILPISLLLILELLAYLISFIKFKRTIATHSLLAKLWTLTLLLFLIELILNSTSYTFVLCFVLGVISRVEIILIIATLKNWTTDVPSIITVRKINNGQEIKKNKWFNS